METTYREPLDFWKSSWGKIILGINKDNYFDNALVRQYFTSLIGNGDPKWKHELNRIALSININPYVYQNNEDLIEAMTDRLSAEFDILKITPCITKGKINDIIDETLGIVSECEKSNNSEMVKRVRITEEQFNILIPTIIKKKKDMMDGKNRI